MTRSVSVGLNGSPESVAAARWAAGEARRRELPLRLIYAGKWLPSPGQEAEEPDLAEGWPTRMLTAVVTEIGMNHPGLPISTVEVKGLPVEALTAGADDAAVLALGSRALSGVGGFVFGSTALGVVAGAVRPVVLVRRHATEAGGSRSADRDVVLGLDTRQKHEANAALLAFAFEAAARRRTTLRVVHTWRLPSSHAGPIAPDLPHGTDQAEAVSEALRPWRAEYPDLPVEERCTRGRAAGELVGAGSTASLLVVGRAEPHHPMGPRIGPVALAVIHHAACPVAVVPHG